MLAIAIDRDSAHVGGDQSNHAGSIKLDPTATLHALLDAIQTMHYLPRIHGEERINWISCLLRYFPSLVSMPGR